MLQKKIWTRSKEFDSQDISATALVISRKPLLLWGLPGFRRALKTVARPGAWSAVMLFIWVLFGGVDITVLLPTILPYVAGIASAYAKVFLSSCLCSRAGISVLIFKPAVQGSWKCIVIAFIHSFQSLLFYQWLLQQWACHSSVPWDIRQSQLPAFRKVQLSEEERAVWGKGLVSVLPSFWMPCVGITLYWDSIFYRWALWKDRHEKESQCPQDDGVSEADRLAPRCYCWSNLEISNFSIFY